MRGVIIGIGTATAMLGLVASGLWGLSHVSLCGPESGWHE